MRAYLMRGKIMVDRLKIPAILAAMKTAIFFAILTSQAMHQMPPLEFPQAEDPQGVFVRPKCSLVWINTVEQVKQFEGFYSRPYTCAGGRKTIGYGHTAKAKNLSFVSKSEAHKLLMDDMEDSRQKVLSIVKVPLTEAQLAALASFTMNCGEGSLRQLVNGPDRLNAGHYGSVEKLLPQYCKAKGKTLRGLKNRRNFELTLWRSGDNFLASK